MGKNKRRIGKYVIGMLAVSIIIMLQGGKAQAQEVSGEAAELSVYTVGCTGGAERAKREGFDYYKAYRDCVYDENCIRRVYFCETETGEPITGAGIILRREGGTGAYITGKHGHPIELETGTCIVKINERYFLGVQDNFACPKEGENLYNDIYFSLSSRKATLKYYELNPETEDTKLIGSYTADQLPVKQIVLKGGTGEIFCSDRDHIWKRNSCTIHTCDRCSFTEKTSDHKYGEWKTLKEATYTASGKQQRTCQECNKIEERKLAKLPRVSIQKVKVTGIPTKNKIYTGKALRPAVKAVCSGSVLKPGSDYTVSYKNCTYPGRASVVITGKGKYSGSKALSFYIQPNVPKVSIKTVKKGKKGITVEIKETKGIGGSTVLYAKNKTFTKGKKTVSVKGAAKTITLKKGTYYVKIRSYKKTGSKTLYSTYTKVKKVVVK